MGEKPSHGFVVILYYGDEPDTSSSPLFVTPGTHTVLAIAAQRTKVSKPAENLVHWNKHLRASCVDTTEEYRFLHVNSSKSTLGAFGTFAKFFFQQVTQ